MSNLPSSGITKPSVAVQIGGNYIDSYYFFKWHDKVVQLGQEHIPINSNSKFADKIGEFENQVREFGERIAKSGVDLKQDPLSIYLGNAGPSFYPGSSNPVLIPPFYKVQGDKAEPILYRPSEGYLGELQAKGHAKLFVVNDSHMVMEYALQKIAQKDESLLLKQINTRDFRLNDGDITYEFISGQGTNGSGAKVSNRDGVLHVEDFVSNEPGHLEMPGLYENLYFEGEDRLFMTDPVTGIDGAAEPYTAGCPDAKTNLGPTATVLTLLKRCRSAKIEPLGRIAWRYDDSKPTQRLNDIFNSLYERGMFRGSANPEQYKKFLTELLGAAAAKETTGKLLSHFEKHPEDLTTKGLGQQAKLGNKAAQAVLLYSANRQADFMIHTIESEKRVDQDSTNGALKLITYTGGLARGYFDDYPDAWILIKNRLREKFGNQVELIYVEPKHKFDGAWELAHDTTSGKASLAFPQHVEPNTATEKQIAQYKEVRARRPELYDLHKDLSNAHARAREAETPDYAI